MNKSKLGKLKLLHQGPEYGAGGFCVYCGKLEAAWEPMEECPARSCEHAFTARRNFRHAGGIVWSEVICSKCGEAEGKE